MAGLLFIVCIIIYGKMDCIMFDCKVRSRLTALPFHGISAHAPFWGGIRALPLPFDKLTFPSFLVPSASVQEGVSKEVIRGRRMERTRSWGPPPACA